MGYFFGLGVDVVVEYGSGGRKLDRLELVDPPFGELDAVIHNLKGIPHSINRYKWNLKSGINRIWSIKQAINQSINP